MSLNQKPPAGYELRYEIAGKQLYTNGIIESWEVTPEMSAVPAWFADVYEWARTLLQPLNSRKALPSTWIGRIENYAGIQTPTSDGNFLPRKGCVLRTSQSLRGVLCVTPKLLQPDFSSRMDLLEEILHAMRRPVDMAKISRLPNDLREPRGKLMAQQNLVISTDNWLPYNCHREIYEFQQRVAEEHWSNVANGKWVASKVFPEQPTKFDIPRFERLLKKIQDRCLYSRPQNRCDCDPEYIPKG
ncbi:MAG: hypothetical protein ACRC8S_03225 [Fimbriiglobus sp.]